MFDAAQLQAEVDSFAWYHTIDLGHGVVTKGHSVMAEMLTDAHLPDLRGRSVLDIGAWDGYYSFLAERRGASRVVALDHYAWGVDIDARSQYWNDCLARGELPDQARDTSDFWRPDLPGRRGFDLAHRVFGSRVEPVVADFTAMDLSTLGSFDVVFYLGVLYHMKEPLTCVERLHAVTNQVAVIETVAAQCPGNAGRSLLELHAGGGVNGVGDVLGPGPAGGNRDGRVIRTADRHAKKRQVVDFGLCANGRVQHVERNEPAFMDRRELVESCYPG